MQFFSFLFLFSLTKQCLRKERRTYRIYKVVVRFPCTLNKISASSAVHSPGRLGVGKSEEVLSSAYLGLPWDVVSGRRVQQEAMNLMLNVYFCRHLY